MTGPECPDAGSGALQDAASCPERADRSALLAELVRKWGISADSCHADRERADAFETFVRRALAERVLQMMLQQPDRLMAALYVLDIPEADFRNAMNQGTTPADQADGLAGVILDREIQRMLTRLRYRQKPARPPFALEQTPPEPRD